MTLFVSCILVWCLFFFDQGEGKPTVRNIMQINSEPPMQDVFDVSPCFPFTYKARLLFYFSGISFILMFRMTMTTIHISHAQLLICCLPNLTISRHWMEYKQIIIIMLGSKTCYISEAGISFDCITTNNSASYDEYKFCFLLKHFNSWVSQSASINISIRFSVFVFD